MSGEKRLPNGNLLVQVPAETDGVTAHGLVEIGPDHPLFPTWDQWLRKQAQLNRTADR